MGLGSERRRKKTFLSSGPQRSTGRQTHTMNDLSVFKLNHILSRPLKVGTSSHVSSCIIEIKTNVIICSGFLDNALIVRALLCSWPPSQMYAFFTAHILTCHRRERTHATINIRDVIIIRVIICLSQMETLWAGKRRFNVKTNTN